MADSDETFSAFQNIQDKSLKFSVQIHALQNIDFPSEVRPIVNEIWEKAYIFRNYHLVVIRLFVQSLRRFLTYFDIDPEDLSWFVESIEDARTDVNALNRFCEKIQMMLSKLNDEVLDLKSKAENEEKKASDRERESDEKIAKAKIEKENAELNGCCSAIGGIGIGLVGLACPAYGVVCLAGQLIGLGCEVHQFNKASKKIAEITNEEIKKGNAVEVVNSLKRNVYSCIEILSIMVRTFYIEVNKCNENLTQIESILKEDKSKGKLIYLRSKGEAKTLSNASLNLNAIVPLCMDLLKCSHSNVPDGKKSDLALTWEEYL
mmetsp:Transcript_14730/g.21937  ORF Transcript_14730/g.21937 Transcript_14730/m.21937 type:complete len:319 (+) Transcript_14730:56-1012(+)